MEALEAAASGVYLMRGPPRGYKNCLGYRRLYTGTCDAVCDGHTASRTANASVHGKITTQLVQKGRFIALVLRAEWLVYGLKDLPS